MATIVLQPTLSKVDILRLVETHELTVETTTPSLIRVLNSNHQGFDVFNRLLISNRVNHYRSGDQVDVYY